MIGSWPIAYVFIGGLLALIALRLLAEAVSLWIANRRLNRRNK